MKGVKDAGSERAASMNAPTRTKVGAGLYAAAIMTGVNPTIMAGFDAAMRAVDIGVPGNKMNKGEEKEKKRRRNESRLQLVNAHIELKADRDRLATELMELRTKIAQTRKDLRKLTLDLSDSSRRTSDLGHDEKGEDQCLTNRGFFPYNNDQF